MKAKTRKRLEWVGTIALGVTGFGPVLGAIHADRWPRQGVWFGPAHGPVKR